MDRRPGRREPKKPKTAPTGKRYLCARCRKRSPRPVFTPAPWYCERCLRQMAEAANPPPEPPAAAP